jgi:hypothetical protein
LLSLFDHAARADSGSFDQSISKVRVTDPVVSVKATAARAVKSIPKSAAPKAHPPKTHPARTHPPKTHPPTIRKSVAHAPKVQVTRREQVRTSKVRQPRSHAVRSVARAKKNPARTTAVRQKLSPPAPLSSLTKLADLPRAGLAKLPKLPSWPKLPSVQQVPRWPQVSSLPKAQLTAWPQLPPWSQLPGQVASQLPATVVSQLPGSVVSQLPGSVVLARTTALLSPSQRHQPLTPWGSAQAFPLPPTIAPAPGLFGVTKPPAAQAHPRTAPLPAPPRQPADRSTSTDQARDSGSGNAPATGTVSSSWRPDMTAAGRRLATDLIALGRTTRYAGPPS